MRALIVIFLLIPSVALADYFPYPQEVIDRIRISSFGPHEARPVGVPSGFDWARGGRVNAGNDPGSKTAITGWGQVFRNAPISSSGHRVQLRELSLYVCAGRPARWYRLQSGGPVGRVFNPDFAGNISQPPVSQSQTEYFYSVEFPYAKVFHFWPKVGRKNLPSTDVCGVLVTFEARLERDVSSDADAPYPVYLAGAGADYWATKTAAWSNYTTNTDVAIGSLSIVRPEWSVFGMTTAGDSDLRILLEDGFTPLP